MIKKVFLNKDLHVERLDISNADADGLKTIDDAGITGSEIVVMNPVTPGNSDPALRDVGHDPNCRIAAAFRPIIERAVLDRVVESSKTEPMHIFTRCIRGSACIEPQVGKRDVSRVIICANDFPIAGG